MTRDGSDDLLDLSGRPRLPRWAYALAALVVAVLVLGVIVTVSGVGRSHPSSHPGSPAGQTTTPSGPAIPGAADDLLMSGGELFALRPDALYRYTPAEGSGPPHGDGVLPISEIDRLLPADSYQLVGDAARGLIWIVGFGSSPASVLAVDARGLSVLSSTHWPAAVTAAAALDGRLYLVTANAVVAVSPDGTTTEVPALTGQYLSVAADPSRNRLLLLDVTARAAVDTYDPGLGAVSYGARLPFGKGDLAVAGGQIWAAGYGDDGAVLVRLDPSTLLPATSSPLAGQLGPGASLVAAGDSSVWVRAGSGGIGLWCVDADTGQARQHWRQAGAVASSTAGAYVIDTSGALEPLRLAGCRG